MKSNAYVNTSFFNAVELSTQAITSGIMVCHPLLKAGTYSGSVFKQQNEVGTFTIVCSESVTETQADIDLYKIDSNLQKNCDCKSDASYKIRPGGYAIFFASFGVGGYQVVLQSGDKDNAYTTTKLQKGDVVLAMLMRPGSFEMTGYNQQIVTVYVDPLQNKDESYKIMAQSVNITLNDVEFSSKEVKLLQGQGLAVSFETEGGINIKLRSTTDRSTTDIKFDKQRRHNWENPKYKYPKNF